MAKARDADLGEFLDLRSDYGFKRAFGSEEGVAALIEFLNTLLPSRFEIRSLVFIDTAAEGQRADKATVVYDLLCRSQDGTYFILEIQRRIIPHLHSREVSYVSRLFDRGREKGSADYENLPVVLVSIRGQSDPELPEGQLISVVQLRDEASGMLYSDLLTIVVVQLSAFAREPNDLRSLLDLYLFAFIHPSRMPEILDLDLKTEALETLLERSRIAMLSDSEYFAYEAELKRRRDLSWALSYERKEGRQEGLEQGLAIGEERGSARGDEARLRSTVFQLAAMGMDVAMIAEAVRETEDRVRAILESPKE